MEDYRLGRGRGAIPRSHKIAQCRGRTGEQANKRTGEQGCSSFVVRSRGVERLGGARLAVRYRAWLIREFREIKEFRDVRAMPATNQVSDVIPLNRAARSLTSLNSLISLTSLLTARYHHAPKRGSLTSEGCRVLHSAKMPSMGSTKAYVPLTAFFVRGRNRPLITSSYHVKNYRVRYIAP